MKRFLIVAAAALMFGAPAMAQSYGGHYGQPSYSRDSHPGRSYASRSFDHSWGGRAFDGDRRFGFGDRGYGFNGRGYGYGDRGYRHQRREIRHHRRGHDGRHGYRGW